MTNSVMSQGEKAGWAYIRVIVDDAPTTQRDIAEQFGVSEVTVRNHYKKILKKNGFGLGSNISDIKKFLEREGK